MSEHKQFFGKRVVSIYSEQMAKLTENYQIILLRGNFAKFASCPSLKNIQQGSERSEE